MSRRSRFGIGRRIIALFFLAPLLSISVFGALSLDGMQRLGEDIQGDSRKMGADAVQNSTASLMELARKKMMDDAAAMASRTELLLEGAMADAVSLRDAAAAYIGGNHTGNLSRYVEDRYSRLPYYNVLGIDGTATGASAPVYSHMFVADGSGRMLSVAGQEAVDVQNISYGSEHYFSKAAETSGTGRDTFIYDAFMYNDSAGNFYWEPAVAEGVKVEDMVVLPSARQRPFPVALPSNIDQLRNRTYEQQASLSTRVLPSDGNWNSRQLGMIVMAMARSGGRLSAVAGIVMTLASVTRHARELGQRELAEGRTGYGYMFNPAGVLVSHPLQYHIGSDSSWHWWIIDMKRNDTGFISYSWRGIYKFISYHEVRLPGMDKSARWMAVATSPSSDFTAPASEAARVIGSKQNDTVAGISGMIRGTQMQFLWLGGLVLLVALAAGMVLSAFIVRPIRHLTEVAAQLGQGDRDILAREVERARVKKDIAGRTDEIGGLAVALDQVIKNLHEDLEKNRRQSAELVRAVQDKPTTMNLEIKDSIIYRSEVGQYGGGRPAPAPESKGYAICPYCGKELRFPRMPSFCPFCRQKLE